MGLGEYRRIVEWCRGILEGLNGNQLQRRMSGKHFIQIILTNVGSKKTKDKKKKKDNDPPVNQ